MKNVTFLFSHPVGLAQRRFEVWRMPNASDGTTLPGLSVGNTLGGAVQSHTTDLPDNQIWQARLVDTRVSGEVSLPATLEFNTGSLQFPGPVSADDPEVIRILSMEDISSQSSSSLSSLSSSSILAVFS